MNGIFFKLLFILGFFFYSQSSASENNDPLKQDIQQLCLIDETIRKEMDQICYLESFEGISDTVLWLYNDLGISHFFRGNFELALGNFAYILEATFSRNDKENVLIGAALWGRALCHACLDMENEMDQDLDMLKIYFENVFQDNQTCKSYKSFRIATKVPSYSDFIIQTKVEFAYPDEYISAAECRRRVIGSADKLKLFVAPLIKSTSKRVIFMQFIEALQEQGIYCCRDGTFWTTCVTPILEKLDKWKVVGIPADPAWD